MAPSGRGLSLEKLRSYIRPPSQAEQIHRIKTVSSLGYATSETQCLYTTHGTVKIHVTLMQYGTYSGPHFVHYREVVHLSKMCCHYMYDQKVSFKHYWRFHCMITVHQRREGEVDLVAPEVPG